MSRKLALLAGLFALALMPGPSQAGPPDALITVDTDTTLVQSYTGLGVQWDPSDVVAYTDTQWTRIFRRVDYLKPSFIRCCLVPTFYCAGFDAQGQPRCQWDTPVMGRLYKILDYCQSRHIPVLLGEWGPSFGMQTDDPRWSRLIGDCLEHLIRARGYTCIQYYNKQNEPKGDAADFARWKVSQESLAAELRARGLARQVVQVGPDTSGSDLLWWVDTSVDTLPQTLGVYEAHWYAGDDEITGGLVEKTLRRRRDYAASHDPAGWRKPFWIAEAGTSDTLAAVTGDWNSGDSNTKIRDFSYGVFMADYLVQTLRAGVGGVSAWDLDDSMHPQAKIAPTPENPRAYNLKQWGFWNTLGSAMGHPEDENLRPWFYAWSVLCRAFPRGAQIVSASGTGLPGVRASAALIAGGPKQQGGRQEMSLALVNDSNTPRVVRIVVPNALGSAAFREYDYFDKKRPADAEGFAVMARALPGVRLQAGLTVALPARGLVVLTTVGGGSPARLTRGIRAPAKVQAVRGAEGAARVARGDTLLLEAAVVPDNGAVRWSVSGPSGMATDKAVISRTGRLTARKLGRVKVTAAGTAGAASTIITITADRLVVDNLTDWDKTYSHTGHWTFETVHPALFEGAPSHLKRTSDTPESLVYRALRLSAFAVRVYHQGALAGRVKAYTSSDGTAWTEVALTDSAAVPTHEGFLRTDLRPAILPPGTNYLKITLAGDPVVYSPQISRVTLWSQPAGSAGN